MSILDQAKSFGYRIRLNPEDDSLEVIPWTLVPLETRRWFVENRAEVIGMLKAEIQNAADNKQKVGTTLKTLIEKKIPKKMLASVPKATCGCQNYEKKMNAWGVDGCAARENEIVNHLVKQADSMGAVARAVPVKIKQRAAKKLLGVAIKIEKRRS